MSKVFLFVNGIRTRPGESKNWTGRAVTATHLHFKDTSVKAEKIEYHTWAVTRRLKQQYNARKLSKVAHFYSDWDKDVIGHSNGGDIILDAMRQKAFVINHLHLVSAAITPDCLKNGISAFMKEGWIKKLTIYIAEEDKILRVVSRSWLAKKLFDYGDLGLTGPSNLPFPHEVIREKNHDHSTWWTPPHFMNTMKGFWKQ